MAWTSAQQQYCEYVICTVESGCDYAAVNMNDPITLGIGQFYAYNAAALMERLRDEAAESYAKLSSRLQDAVSNHPSTTDATWWTGFYLYNDDADSWVASAQDAENHAVQDEFFMNWVFGAGGAFDTLANWGMTTDNVKQTIFMLSVYHQAPASANQILANIGGGRSLDDYLNATLNTWPVSGYSNRYNRVYNLLNEWDGTSNPPDFGQSDYAPGNNPNTNGQESSSIGRIEQVGNDLMVYGVMGTGMRLLCRNTGNGVWVPVRNATAPNYPGTGGGSSTGGGSEEFLAMKALWESVENQFQYAQAAGRLEPDVSGFTDCSACIWWAANKVTNNKYEWLGTSTYTMRTTATKVCDGIQRDLMKPGDLILMYTNGGGEHVGWYWGDGVAWGAGSAPCPHVEADPVENYNSWGTGLMIYRFLED